MYKCNGCNRLLDEVEEMQWKENHGFTHGPFEQHSGCPSCGETCIEIEPCRMCGAYPLEEYEYGYSELPYGGICEACLNDLIRTYFMEFLETLDSDAQIDFYIGTCKYGRYDGGFYDRFDILLAMKSVYARDLEMDKHTTDLKFGKHISRFERHVEFWTQFIKDYGAEDFAEWSLAETKAVCNKNLAVVWM